MNKFKNGILLFISIFLTLSFSCQAQSQSSDSVSLREGSWALQFGIAANFTLTSFQGSTIGAKYQLSENNAIRGGITINGSTNNGTNSYSGAIGDTSEGTVPGSSSVKSATVSFVLQYLWYMHPNGPVHFYAGVGPSVSYGYSNNSSNISSLFRDAYNHGYWVQQLFTSNSTQWAIGGSAVAGVEWFACHWLSLHADYNESILYQWYSTSLNEDYRSLTNTNYIPYVLDRSGKTKGWALISGGVSFGLNIYL
ncbi:MAG: hypothetical protein ACYCVH_15325 [Ignavibacteriaceae bacterium]